uniref:citron Rho-interacting kinase-like isoform X2 n=1 Tax=Styela clava TaxID=7725 RepID=UPI001939D55B|nr:citron Rho-interacting kinase-like isoform X2 [Styela clava]
MENREFVSRILELQNSAAKSSTLESQNDEYVKRTAAMQEEIKDLRANLKQVEAVKNTFERDMAVYITENKSLKQQVSVLKSAHDKNASTSARLLHEIKDGNKKLMSLREEEYQSNLDRMKEELTSSKGEWTEKFRNLETKNNMMRSDKRDLEKKIQELSTKLTESDKANSSSSLKSKIQVQALENKLTKLDDDARKINEKHQKELKTLQQQLEDREKQLGAQSNINKRIHKDLKTETDEIKQQLQNEVSKNKELNNQILRLELKVKSSSENLKHFEEEKTVKLKSYEEQISVLKKDVNAKSSKIEELQQELYEVHDSNTGELQDLKNNIVVLKNDKRNALNKNIEITEELESLKRGMSREMENIKDTCKQEMDKLKKEFKEKEKHSAAQSCISRKVQEDMKRKLENEKSEIEGERIKNNKLNNDVKRLELQLKSSQDSAKTVENDNTLKLKLSEEKVSSLQQEILIKNKKVNELQKQLLEAQEMNGKDMEELTEKLATVKREKRNAQEKINELNEEISKSERIKSKAESGSKILKEKHENVVRELDQMTKKFNSMEEKCADLEEELDSHRSKSSKISEMRHEITQLRSDKRTLESELKDKEDEIRRITSDQRKLSAVEKSAKENENKLKKDLESVEIEMENMEKEYKSRIDELEDKLSETKRKLAAQNITSVTMCKRAEEDFQKQIEEKEKLEKVNIEQLEQERGNIEKLKQELEEALTELEIAKDEKAALEEKFDVLRENCTVIETLEEQLDEYHEKCQQLQEQNASLIEKLAVSTREKGGANRKVEKYENENKEQLEKMEETEKALETLKQTCVMLEEQIVGLENINNQLMKNQEELSEEKEKAVKDSRNAMKRLGELEHTIALEKRRGVELKENVDEEMIELQVQAREEANKVQELQDELSDLERKYKLLEMNANSLQQKLNNEKDMSERYRQDAENSRSRMATLESVRQQTSSGLRSEIERADALAHEKTALQNNFDTMKMKQSHESIKMNCTLGQQSKLIDFLQAKVESLEPHDKKKKKKKNDLYQVPLQYRELQDMLEESKQTNIQLQQKVNDLRTELQDTKSDVHRLKHGITGATPSSSSQALSPGSMAAISALLKSPNTNVTPLSGNTRSKPRMHHNIPHRLVENLCIQTTKCSVCLDTVRFGRMSLKCTECHSACHIKCRSNMTSTCGLPGGLVQHYKQGGSKIHSASPVSCITNGSETDGNAQGWLKVFCGGTSWERKFVQLRDGVVIISNTEKPLSSSKKLKIDVSNKEREIIDLVKQQGYVHSTVPVSELESSAKADIPYVFKLELGPDTSCWPPRNLYFLSSGFTDKQKWVSALEAITTRNSVTQSVINESKIIGNKIVTMQVNEKLEINCSLPISKEKVIFGCDEGLYVLSPSTSSVSDRSHMTKVTGAQQILQMNFLKSPNLIVAIEGPKRRIVTFDVNNLMTSTKPSEMSVKLIPVDDLSSCHLFAVGSVEGAPHLCSATAAGIQIHRFNSQLKKFVKRKEISTSEPCTCLQFTMCSIIMGTNKFYEIELKSYKVDEFLDLVDRSLSFDHDSFPVSVLQIGEKNGKYEYLLCYHEFGVFVDCFGKRTRKENMVWSRLPLSFAYKSPYLIITHFHSVEIIRISPYQDYNDSLTTQQSYINLPSPRYLGPAITEGAAYFSANEGGKITVFCCKGNMDLSDESKENKDDQKACLKRRRMQLAASSQESLDDDIQARPKRTQRSPSIGSSSTILSDTTNMSVSCESLLSCNTSRWTLGSKMTHFPGDTPKTSMPRRFRNYSHDSIDSTGTMTSDATYKMYTEDDSSSIQSSSSNNSNNNNSNRLMMWKPVTPGSGKKVPPEKPIRKSKTPNKLNFDPVDV